MEIEQTIQGEITILRFLGELELSTCRDVDQRVREILAPRTPKVVLDLKETKYVDSSGLGVLVSLYSHVRRREGKLAIANPNRSVKRLFDLTNVQNFLPIYDSLDEAITAVQ